MQKIKSFFGKLWLAVPSKVLPVFHTFWQAAAGVLVSGLLVARSTSDVKLTVAGAVATGLAAVKALVKAKLSAQAPVVPESPVVPTPTTPQI